MSITAGELAKKLGAVVVGNPDVAIEGIAKIEEATSSDVSFVANSAYRKYLDSTAAGAVIVDEPLEGGSATYLVTPEPYVTFLKTLKIFHPESPHPEAGIHPSAVIGKDVKISNNATVGPLCVLEDGVVIGDGTILRSQVFVGRGTVIGDNCLFHSRVTIRENCVVGDRVILQDGCVIGSDGFGFAQQEGAAYAKIPQVGNVILEDDVEIGANTAIDRATMGRTVIRKGVKLDNLVQVGHNVEIGANTVMAGQAGVAGSTKIGAQSMFGGQVGIAGHLRLSDRIMVAAQSGIVKDPGMGKIVGGSPARDIHEWQRIEAYLSRLKDLFKRVKTLEEKAGEGEAEA